MKTKLITARMDEQEIFQIEYLKKHLRSESTTQVLRNALNCLYQDVKQKEVKKTPFELLEELHLIGSFEGEKELSIDYKKKISKYVEQKHRSSKIKKKNHD